MPLNIIRNDITRVSADAIVNTANPRVAVGAGVDQAIYEAAGPELLLAERAKIGPMEPGQAAVTPAFGLDAKYIIHTVGPAWRGGAYGEREAVASCYRRSLELAAQLDCASIAFPLISTGTYGFPKDEALKIAISEISSFLFTHDMTVYMVVYSREAFVISSKAFSDIQCYIEDKDVRRPTREEYDRARNEVCGATGNLMHGAGKSAYQLAREAAGTERRRRLEDAFYHHRAKAKGRADAKPDPEEQALFSSVPLEEESCFTTEEEVPIPAQANLFVGYDSAGPSNLDDILSQKTESFQQMLFRIIDRKGMSDPEVYKKANLDRKLFSKIRSSENYLPKKKTVLALAVALELNMDETIDLLRRAGIALNPSSRFDLIVGYCIDRGIYNIFEINTYLFEYDQPLLGA